MQQRARGLAAPNALVEDEALRQALHHIGVAARLGWLGDEGAARTQFLDAYLTERERRAAEAAGEAGDALLELGSVPDGDSIMGDAAATDGAATMTDPIAAQTGQRAGIPAHGAAPDERADADRPSGGLAEDRVLGGDDGRPETDWRAPEQLASAPEPSRFLPRNDPSRKSPSGNAQTTPDRHMGRWTPKPEAPPIPDYRAGVGPVAKEWQRYHEVVFKRFPDDANTRQLVMEIFAAEGGRERDKRSGAVGGLLPSTLVNLKKIYRDDPEMGKLPDDPGELTLEQLAIATEAYFDDSLKSAGGIDALLRLEQSNLPLSIADVVFREAPEQRTDIFRRAFEKVDKNLSKGESNRVKAAFAGKPNDSLIRRTMAASSILVELGKGAVLCTAIADARDESRGKEKERHQRFRCK
ncbi:MAG: hypothetical protein ACKVSF_12365 [Alphaproteobacteria bacterium]